MATLKGRDLLHTRDLTGEEVDLLVQWARAFQSRTAVRESPSGPANQAFAVVQDEIPADMRLVLAAAAPRIGAAALFLSRADLARLGAGGPRQCADLLDPLADVILASSAESAAPAGWNLAEIARFAERPVVDLRGETDVPVTALADLLTLRDVFGDDLKGRRIVLHWTPAASADADCALACALLGLLTRFGADVVLAHPAECDLPESSLRETAAAARSGSTRFEVTHSPEGALRQADAIYGLNWAPWTVARRGRTARSAEERHEAAEQLAAIATRLRGWAITDDALRQARPRAVHMHAPPVERGLAVADAVLDSPQSICFQQAANRLHMTSAVLSALLRDRPGSA